MVEILIGIGILGGLGLIFGLVLSAASKVVHVETDPRLDALNDCLPGANCGGCGYAGCAGYAEAVLTGWILSRNALTSKSNALPI